MGVCVLGLERNLNPHTDVESSALERASRKRPPHRQPITPELVITKAAEAISRLVSWKG